MVYKTFRVICILRILFLAATLLLFFYLLFQTNLYAALFITAVIIIYQVYSLIHYVEKTNRDLTRFFQSIKYEDFSQTFKDDKRGLFFFNTQSRFY